MRHDAKASPAEAIRFAVPVHRTAGSSVAIPVSPLACDGSGAPSGRRGFAFVVAALAAAAALCLSAGPASAAYIHPSSSYEFGSDGTSGTTIPEAASLTYNQATNQVLALSKAAPRKIYGFNFTAPASFTPAGSPFPLPVPDGGYYVQIDVDNSGTASAGNIFYAPEGENMYSYAADGTPLPAVSPEPGNKCGAAVDKNGHPWSSNYSGPRAEEFEWSGGAPIRTLSTINEGYSCLITFDRSNNDLYLPAFNGLFRYSAASNYSSAVLIAPLYNPLVAIDAVKHIVFAAVGTTVYAYDAATGSQLEEFTASGEIRGIAVDDDTDTVFLSTSANKIQEWRPVVVPDVTTGDPVGTSKVVTGSVGLAGGGEVISCKFEWKLQGAASFEPGKEVACSPATPYTTDKPEVEAELPGLEGEQTYVYRLSASNANGTGHGATKTITPHNVFGLHTDPATEIERQSATFNGSFEGNGQSTSYYFEYGTGSVSEHTTGTEDAGAPTGPATVATPVSGLTAGATYQYRVVATNTNGISKGQIQTFETDPPIKGLLTKPATEVKTDEAILNGSLDPDGYETEYFFEYGKTAAYGLVAPLDPAEVGTTAPGVVDVSAPVDNLEVGTTYHFRIAATNPTGTSYGADETFETRAAPSIVSFASDNVTASTAELKAQINPNGFETTYWFEYGPTVEYGFKAPSSGGTLPATSSVEPVFVQLSELQGTTYHFRLIAENVWGTTTTEDQSFSFNPPEGCPNSTVRQQTGAAYLPDCRAYELVSPGKAGGAALFSIAPITPYASSPSRLAFGAAINAIPGTGEPLNGGFGDLYVASRTSSGWKTHYVGLPGWHSIAMGPPRWRGLGLAGIPTDRPLNHVLVWDWGNQGIFTGGTLAGSSAPYVYDNEGNELGRLPTNWDEVSGSTKDLNEGGWIGDAQISADYTHYIFSSRELPFAEGGLDEAPGSVYDNDIAADTEMVISKTPSGGDIPQDVLAGSGKEFIKIPAISTDGMHVLMSTQAANGGVHLYLTANDTEYHEVSLGEDDKNHGVNFLGMTEDGSTVYFSSNEPLTSEDTDNSTDIYVWREATDSVTLASKGSGSSGNGTSCSAFWIGGCSVEPIPLPPGFEAPPMDQRMASGAGDFYFYSPEQLDGSRGQTGARNLYVYRGGSVRFVAQLQPFGGATRMNVSPDGSHMAMITSTQLTSYDPAGHAEMYTYDATDRSIKCVSCLPSGKPPTSDVKGSQNGLFLTQDGRAFFSTEDSLVLQDANGIVDVYEFVEGRPQLISTGTGDYAGTGFLASGLIGVSVDGSDVYFGTFSTLVPEDQNGGVLKFYDARTNGGFEFQEAPAPCAAADECHGAEASAPAAPPIGTGAHLAGRGNFQPGHKHRKKHRKSRRCNKHKHKQCHRNRPSHDKGERGGRHG